jgi:hypothetical protein
MKHEIETHFFGLVAYSKYQISIQVDDRKGELFV